MRRFLPALALPVAVVAAVAVLAYLTQGPEADLVWTAVGEVTTLDPARMTALQDGRVADALFEGLAVLDPRSLEPRPGVAERWDVSDDGRTYTFHLRADARWSDGRSVTAEDFAYSWRRALDPETAAEYAYMLFPIRGAKAYYKAAAKARNEEQKAALWSEVGVRVEGPRRLVVDLERPTAYFLDLAAFSTYLPVRRDVVESWGDNWIFPPHIISNGAYRLTQWRFQSRMRWEKNPYYWNAGTVALEQIEVRVYEEPNTALLAYETGEIDLTTSVPALAKTPLLEASRAGRRRDVLNVPNLGTYFYRFNCTKGALADPRVRRALALALDRREIVDRAARGGQMPATVLVPPGMAGYESPAGLVESVEEARRLLAEAGYAGGEGLPEFALLVNKGGESHVAVAEMVQQQWRDRIGVRTRIEQVEWKVFLDRVHGLDYEIAREGWYGDYVDPNTFLDLFVTGGGNNKTGWSNRRYDALVERAANETDAAARARTLAEAEAILLAETPIVPIYFYTTVILVRPGLVGVEPNLLNRIDFGRLRWPARHSLGEGGRRGG